MKRVLVLVLVVPAFVLALPGLAHACPSCVASQGEDYQLAYLLTAVLMTFLPLGFVGGLLLWAFRRAEASDTAAGAGADMLASTERAE